VEQLGDAPAALTEYRVLPPYFERCAATDPGPPLGIRRRTGRLPLSVGDRPVAREALTRLLYDAERVHGPHHAFPAEVRRTLARLGQVHGQTGRTALPDGHSRGACMDRRISRTLACAAVFTVALGVAGCKDTTIGASPSGAPASGGSTATTGSGPASTSAPDAPHGSALAAANALTVKGRAPKTGYSREQFGPAWADVDHDHCDTRDDILKRDLTQRSYRSDTKDCIVTGGTLADPYTGRRIVYKRGASKVDIDHTVALSDAWQKGARTWSKDRREDFANDPLNLLAVDASTNRGKGDGDTATWLPPNKGYRCSYVARQVAVKKKYGLWVTSAEKNAMRKVLDTCPKQPMPAG
jgi:hypothetical protein